MAWPASAAATGDLISAPQMNGLPVRIANTTLSASAASIDFTSIPGHYAHLMLVAYLRSDEAVTASTVRARFNGDTAANYDRQHLGAVAAATSASEAFAATAAVIGGCSGGSAPANLFGTLRLVVPHYAQAADNKAALSRWGTKWGTTSGTMETFSAAAFWRSSVAITRLELLPGAGNFVSGSRATLIGLP